MPGQTVKFAQRVRPVTDSIEFRLHCQQCERDVVERGIRDRSDVGLALPCLECGNDDRVQQSVERNMAFAQRGERTWARQNRFAVKLELRRRGCALPGRCSWPRGGTSLPAWPPGTLPARHCPAHRLVAAVTALIQPSTTLEFCMLTAKACRRTMSSRTCGSIGLPRSSRRPYRAIAPSGIATLSQEKCRLRKSLGPRNWRANGPRNDHVSSALRCNSDGADQGTGAGVFSLCLLPCASACFLFAFREAGDEIPRLSS